MAQLLAAAGVDYVEDRLYGGAIFRVLITYGTCNEAPTDEDKAQCLAESDEQGLAYYTYRVERITNVTEVSTLLVLPSCSP